MTQVLILLRKSLLTFSRARAAIAITFIVPIALIYLFGHVFGLYGGGPGPQGIPLAVVNESPEPAARDLVAALRAEKGLRVITETTGANGVKRPLTEADVRAAIHDNDYRFALILPRDLFGADHFGVRMTFLANPQNDIETQTVNGLLQKNVFSKVPQLLGQSLQRRAREFLGDDRFREFNRTIAGAVSRNFGGDQAAIERRMEAGDFFGMSHPPAAPPDPTLRRLDQPAASGHAGITANATATGAAANDASAPTDIFSRIVNIRTEQVVGKEVKSPMAARTVGGYAIMFLLFAVSGSAASMFEERDSGVFQRLLSSPVRPTHILWARFLFGMILGLVQIATLFVAGRIFFGLEILNHGGALLVVALSAAAACSAFGMLIAAFSPSAPAANGIATFVVLSMSAVGGAWFPTTFMPEYIQRLSKLTLVYWSVEGFTDVLWAGQSILQVLPTAGVLLGIAAVVLAVSIWRFNRSRFFE